MPEADPEREREGGGGGLWELQPPFYTYLAVIFCILEVEFFLLTFQSTTVAVVCSQIQAMISKIKAFNI